MYTVEVSSLGFKWGHDGKSIQGNAVREVFNQDFVTISEGYVQTQDLPLYMLVDPYE